MVISYNARAIQKLNVVTSISAAALCINAVLNYLLIFGKGGMPFMGVKGAAIATLIARCRELAAIMIYVYGTKNHPFRGTFHELFGFPRSLFAKVMRMAIPVVFTEGGWALSFALIFAAYGRLGTSALAVAQVVNVVCDLLQSFYFGVGNSTAMLIGETLGQGVNLMDDANVPSLLSMRFSNLATSATGIPFASSFLSSAGGALVGRWRRVRR